MSEKPIKEWITVHPNGDKEIKGHPIPVKEGQTKKEAIDEVFDSLKKDNGVDGIRNSKYFLEKDYSKAISNLGTLKGTEEQKSLLKNILDSRKINDEELEDVISYFIRRGSSKNGLSINEVKLRKEGNSYFSEDKILYIGLSSKKPAFWNIAFLNHEIGHGLDFIKEGTYRSSSFISKKYNKTLSDMVKEEISKINNLDVLIDSINVDTSLTYEKAVGTKTKEDTEEYYYYSMNGQNELVTLQSVFGYKNGKLNIYERKYFENPVNVGTEVFAMIMESKTAYDKKHKGGYIDFMKKYAPKTLEIFNEIIDDFINNEVLYE